MNCNQHDCELPAVYLFTWPGKDQAGICDVHAVALRNIADAMGLHLQLIPIEEDDASD